MWSRILGESGSGAHPSVIVEYIRFALPKDRKATAFRRAWDALSELPELRTLERAVTDAKITRTDFNVLAVAALSEVSEGYTAALIALSNHALVQTSIETALVHGEFGADERIRWLQSRGHLPTPKSNAIVINNNPQAIGLSSLEDSLDALEPAATDVSFRRIDEDEQANRDEDKGPGSYWEQSRARRAATGGSNGSEADDGDGNETGSEDAGYDDRDTRPLALPAAPIPVTVSVRQVSGDHVEDARAAADSIQQPASLDNSDPA